MLDVTQSYRNLSLLIDGTWTNGSGEHTIPVHNPATGARLGQLPSASSEDVQRAIDAAHRAFPGWRNTAPRTRAAFLRHAAALVRREAESLSRLMALELGKPLLDGPAEVERAAQHLEWHAEQSLRTLGEIIPGPSSTTQATLRTPVGPVAAFTPWNGPGASPARKIAAALAAGCTIVIKPAEETPATAIAIAACLQEAGLPAGVLNVVFGDPPAISEALLSSPKIRMMTFTGSVPVGRSLASLAGRFIKPCILELGGHSPVIVCADANPESVARQSVVAKFRNSGQICISPTRFLVHESIYEAFIEHLVAATSALQVGDPLSPETQMGPLIHERRLDAVHDLVRDALKEGATLRAGGKRIGNVGSFYAPTVLTDVPPGARILREEPFGPVAIVQRFSDLREACDAANATDFGLAAYAFTGSAADVSVITEVVETGILSINHFGGASPEVPFGGVKDSGYGREGGTHCFDGYLVSKSVSHKTYLP
jgi:succinate-semialdehyde dehydrogenase / glutarate-semialdehyde dehydrogenase